MRISIVLPGLSDVPIGGYKIQYEYAAGLAERGHSVTIVVPMSSSKQVTVRRMLRYAYVVARHRAIGHRVISWFAVDPRVKIRILPILTGSLLPKAEVTVLTAWQTAADTRNPARRAGRFVQVVYDYEFWKSSPDGVRAQMRSALSRRDVSLFATSPASTEMLGEMGLTPTALVTAGIDLDLFQCLVAPHLRAPVVGFAARSGKIKAIPVMLRACEILHGRRPDISFVSFGHGYSDPMPNFVTHLGPLSPTDLRDFYNKCMIFALSSDYEGWGLPAAEAMACGVALVTTANGGVEDFATDRANALIVPRQDPEALAGAIAELLDDTELRLSLIEKSLLTAQELGLAAAIDRLDGALRKSILTT